MAAKSARTRPSRLERLLGLDGRTRQCRELRTLRDNLLSQVPQPPSPAAVALAERAAVIGLHLVELDRAALQEGGLQPGQLRVYSSLTGQQGRIIKQLGALRTVRPAGPSLDEIFGSAAA